VVKRMIVGEPLGADEIKVLVTSMSHARLVMRWPREHKGSLPDRGEALSSAFEITDRAALAPSHGRSAPAPRR
jgi:hypothetical protein